MTANADIFDALSTWLENEQTFSPALRIAAQRVGFKPTDGETYLLTQFLPNETISRAVGTGKDFYQGLFQVTVVFQDNGTGLIGPQQVADGVIALFPKNTLIPTAEGRQVKIPRTGWSAPLLPDPNRPRIPVSIPYTLVESN